MIRRYESDPREIALGPCPEEELQVQRDYWVPRLEDGIFESNVAGKIQCVNDSELALDGEMDDQSDFLGVEIKLELCLGYGETEGIECIAPEEVLSIFEGQRFFIILSGKEVNLNEINDPIESSYSVDRTEFKANYNIIRNL